MYVIRGTLRIGQLGFEEGPSGVLCPWPTPVDLDEGHGADEAEDDIDPGPDQEPEHLLFGGGDDDEGTAAGGSRRRGPRDSDDGEEEAADASPRASTSSSASSRAARVVSAAAGTQHTVLCDSRGWAWVFGSGYGAGLASAEAWISPSRVRGLAPVVVGWVEGWM